MSWIDPQLLRLFVNNMKADDEELIGLAVDVACGKVEELCGPIEITTVTGEVHAVGYSEQLALKYRATSLVSIGTQAGASLTAADWAVDGQVLTNKSGTCYSDTLVVSYVAGYFDAEDANAKPPAWARSAALHIGQQWLRTVRRFGQTAQAPDGPVGFLVPNAAMEEMEDHLLAPDGFA